MHTAVTIGPVNISGCLGSRGASTGAREGESLSRQAATPLKPGGSATLGTGSGLSGDGDKSSSSSVACWHSLALWCWALLPPVLWLWCLCLNLLRVRGACPAGPWFERGAAPPSSQESCYEVPSPLLSPHIAQGEQLALQSAHWPWP